MPRNDTQTPLLELRLPSPPQLGAVDDDGFADGDPIRKRWYHYLPLILAIAMMLAPHPSLIMIFVNYYYRVHDALLRGLLHMAIVYLLTFLAFSSLIVVLARDPGPVVGDKAHGEESGERADGEEESFLEALLAPPEGEEAHGPGKWCKKCNAPKPERAHHCGSLAFYGMVIGMVIGSFLGYHIYLITTNQTTLESLSPFMLLRHIPPLPDNADSRRLSNPPLEHELSFEQRMLVRDAARYIRLYDIGWRRNWAQVFGWSRPWGWLYRLAIGGSCTGDGRNFPRNPRADEMLSRLAAGLVSADKNR
ncbi:hypothetical protein ACG7TL_006443 [Trametes sanguinea]